jgi:photosystem II stability/assembly factor-like uncharacterized protein
VQKQWDMKKLFALLIVLASIDNAFAQWVTQTYGNFGGDLSSVYFTDANTGYAVGSYGLLLKTTNGGNLWTQQTSGTAYALNSVFFANRNTGYAVGRNDSIGGGIILKTTNAGTQWTMMSFGVDNDIMTSVYFTSPDTGYVTGVNGNILKTSDGGTIWTNQNTGTYNFLLSICFPNVNTGYAVGGYDSASITKGIILKTTNGGVSWINQNSGTTIWIESVFFVNADTGYAVGQWGLILKTTNGGNLWTQQTSATSNTIKSVFFVNADTGYVVVGEVNSGVNGTILKTTNGGVQWIMQNAGTTEWLHSVFFTNADTGYAVGNSCIILKTDDGGGYPLSVTEKPTDSNSLKVYPSPSDYEITIETTKLYSVSNLFIMNLSGKEVQHQAVNGQRTMIDIRNLSTGIYMVKVVGEKGVQVGKFVKQ